MKKLIMLIIFTGVIFAQLTKETVVKTITILQNNSVKVETAVIVKDGNRIIAQKNDYYVLSPGANIINETEMVQNVCNLAWVGITLEQIPEQVNSLKILVDELVAGAVDYFWKSPRANSIQKVQLALVGDMSGIDYLITNYRTRIYKAQHKYVLKQLNKIKEL